ncbi:MAG: SufD family Fe-S cluster assembly protein [Candidatus Gracilibacteria bacterium]|nr:SufD family Fe-S cluster assembly protein [Candidatus Gracilibacteria bacterium]
MMITKSGFYFTSGTESEKIEIGENIQVDIFDDSLKIKTITVGKGSVLNIFSCINSKADLEIFHEYNSRSNINLLVLGSENNTKIKIYSIIENDGSESNLNMVSLVNNEDSIEIDSKIIINKGVKGSSGNIKQNNIFLGEKGSIRSIPGLKIASNESKSSHSMKIEKISDEKLFYLRSRGIDKENAVLIMLESLFDSCFKNLNDDIFKNEIHEKFNDYILR